MSQSVTLTHTQLCNLIASFPRNILFFLTSVGILFGVSYNLGGGEVMTMEREGGRSDYSTQSFGSMVQPLLLCVARVWHNL